MTQEARPSARTKGNIFFVGLLSFFGGISQDVFLPILPLYLANVLGLSKEFIGLAEGLVTSSASLFKIIAGYASDHWRARKPFVFLGYFLSLISRPLLAFTTSTWGVGFLRFVDGTGKGMKDSPKDALIADSTTNDQRGRGFGIVRALDTLGSVAGPLVLFTLLYFLRDNTLKYHYIFLLTALPLAVTLTILSLFVKETAAKKTAPATNASLPTRFYVFLAIMVIFSLGNSSDAFVILRASNLGIGLLSIPLVYALFNFCYASASIPLGGLSDRIGREKVIVVGWLAYALAYLGFALAGHAYQIWLLFAFYGIYYATTEGVAKAFVADMTPSDRRGRAYGIYNSVIGVVALPASTIAGFLWDRYNPAQPFFFGALMACLATILLVVFVYSRQPSK